MLKSVVKLILLLTFFSYTSCGDLAEMLQIPTQNAAAFYEVSSISVRSGDKSLLLSWKDPNEIISNIIVEVNRAGEKISYEVEKGQEEIFFTQLSNGKVYIFTIYTIDFSGDVSDGKRLIGIPGKADLTEQDIQNYMASNGLNYLIEEGFGAGDEEFIYEEMVEFEPSLSTIEEGAVFIDSVYVNLDEYLSEIEYRATLNNQSFTLPGTVSEDGEYHLQIAATYTTTGQQALIQKTFRIDRVSPETPTLQGLYDGARFNKFILLKLNIREEEKYDMWLNNEVVYDRYPVIEPGFYELKVQATRISNNLTSIATYKFEIVDLNPPQPVSALISDQNDKMIKLFWQNPSEDFSHVRIHRSTVKYPASLSEGELVYMGEDEAFVDTYVEDSTVYYYSIFAIDPSSNPSKETVIRVEASVSMPQLFAEYNSNASKVQIVGDIVDLHHNVEYLQVDWGDSLMDTYTEGLVKLNILHFYAREGVYTIRIYIRDQAGNESAYEKEVIVTGLTYFQDTFNSAANWKSGGYIKSSITNSKYQNNIQSVLYSEISASEPEDEDGYVEYTHTIDLKEAVTPYIQFWYIYDATIVDKDACAKIQVSTDNGITWETVYQFVSDYSSVWDVDKADMQAYAGHQILLRFYLAHNKGATKLWVDDIKIKEKSE